MKKTLTKCSILLIMIALMLGAMFSLIFTSPLTSAMTNDIRINLVASSKIAVNNGNFAYTNGTTLYIANDNELLIKESAFTGDLIDFAMSGDMIMLLTSKEGVVSLLTYSYDTEIEVVKVDWVKNGLSFERLNKAISIAFCNDSFYLQHPRAFIKLSTTENCKTIISSVEDNPFANIVDFYISPNKFYFLANGIIYYTDSSTNSIDNIEKECLSYSLTNINSFGYNNDLLIVNIDGVISTINTIDGATTTLQCVNTLPTDNIFVCSVDGVDYAYFFSASDLSIKLYSYNANSLSYINSFDNTKYEPPTDYNILQVGKLKIDSPLYVSPTNKAVLSNLKKDEYVLVFAAKDNHYYSIDITGKIGFVQPENITLLGSSQATPLGATAGVLHNNTPVYQYPYAQSKRVSFLKVNAVVAVISLVAVEDTVDVWGWYKVSYVGEDGVATTGYIKSIDLAPYTALSAPTVYKQAKIKSPKLGETVKAYVLPDDKSNISKEWTDGQMVTLAQVYDKTQEWTLVQIDDKVGYVKTAYLQIEGLTSIQITLIVVGSIVFLATITVLICLYLKKRNSNRI